MWMANPKILCRKHLLGEHVELHMFLGTLKKGNSISGYLSNNLLEPMSIISRHGELVKEMERRGYNHYSEIDHNEVIHYLQFFLENELHTKINKEKAFEDLISRCPECKKRWKENEE
jgi:hypothetical protein